jgi:putative copper resistance protein D
LNDPLIWLRALHFAATASLAGALPFKTLVSDPAVRTAQGDGYMAAIVRRRLAWIVWLSFAFVLVTGAGWFVVQAAQMTEVPPSAVFTEGAAWNVLLNTDFGNVWAARAVLAALFAAALVLETGPLANVRASSVLSTTLAVSLVGALAFAGHAAAGSDMEGAVHLSADILHLVAAAAWLGALLPLAMLLSAAYSKNDAMSIRIARTATLRFSVLGVVSVGTLVATGIINSWFLVGSIDALASTDYGRLLSLKVVLFFVMLSIAAFNRLRLTPRIVEKPGAVQRAAALRQLRNNSLMEAALGLIILFLVGMLGTLPPALHE